MEQKNKIKMPSFFRSAKVWYEGFSTFHVDSEGKIVKHVVEERPVEENRDQQTVEEMRKMVRPGVDSKELKF